MSQQLLLTGATGFIGYYLAHELAANGYRFRALVRPGSDRAPLNDISDHIDFVEGDLLDFPSLEAAVAGCDVIIHAAAMVSFDAGKEDLMLEINGYGTEALVNLAIAHGVRRFIHVSSVAALDRTVKGVISEKNRWQEREAKTAYARSKFAAEREIWRGQAEGLSVAALYPSIVIGAGNWSGESTPSLFKKVAEGLKVYPTGKSGFVDVRDVAKATRLVLERNIDGDRFLLNARNLSWQTAFGMIATSLGKQPPTIAIAPWLSGIAWPFATLAAKITGQPAALTRDTHRTSQAQLSYDGQKIVTEAAFTYRNMEETFQQTGSAYLENSGKLAWF